MIFKPLPSIFRTPQTAKCEGPIEQMEPVLEDPIGTLPSDFVCPKAGSLIVVSDRSPVDLPRDGSQGHIIKQNKGTHTLMCMELQSLML